MNIIKMIVGLSNPQKKYYKTRHNIGSWYIHVLAERYSAILKIEKRFFGFTTSIIINSRCIRLLIPNIFMNINYYSVGKMAKFYNINFKEILFVHDDLDIKPGLLKLTYSYGHSGHNGLRGILNYFRVKDNFYRLRIGIGRPINKEDISDFVLSIPPKIEKLLINKSIFYAINKTTELFY